MLKVVEGRNFVFLIIFLREKRSNKSLLICGIVLQLIFFSYILSLTSYTRQKNNSFSDFDYHRRHFQKSLKGKIVWRAKELCSHISCIFFFQRRNFRFLTLYLLYFFSIFFSCLLKLQLLLL